MKTNQSRLGLLPKEKLTIISLYFAIAIVTVLCFAASTLMGQSYLVLAGLGLMAYVLGLRHGVDADHIAAIDNTTRKLLQDGKRPLTVGMWFSLGHSTIVIAMTLALVVAGKTVLASLPSLQSAGSIIGTLVSGVFLFIIGLINVIIVQGIYKIFSGLRQEKLSEAQLEDALNKKGFVDKTFGKLFDIVKSPWQMYAVGFLFGLGFDTATEVALIAISVGVGISSNVPIWMVLALPLMFTAGMVVVDTSDGISMRLAYGFAFLKPIRKIYYNLTITIISVLVAFLIGGIELIQALSNELGWTGGFWSMLGSLDFETMGYGIVALFIISWLVAMAYYKYKGFEKKTLVCTLKKDW
jgi:high-affinity nickel-transport protein